MTIAPITSTIREIPSEAFLSKADGMPRDGAVNFDHIQTVSKGKIGSVITTISPRKNEQIREAILFALDL